MALDFYSRIHLLPRLHPAGELHMPARLSPIVELRQYTLRPGQREALIELFDREFIESQERLGSHVLGQFRDLDRPERFVWLRGFDDLPTRREALAAFYDGPVWKRHREAANATMVDSDNVLLLRPSNPESAFELDPAHRPPVGSSSATGDDVTCVICSLGSATAPEFRAYFERSVAPALEEEGARVLAYFETETTANNYPRLPVREGENVFVWFAARKYGEPAALGHWLPELRRRLATAPEILRLSPTGRSLLHG